MNFSYCKKRILEGQINRESHRNRNIHDTNKEKTNRGIRPKNRSDLYSLNVYDMKKNPENGTLTLILILKIR